MVNFSPDPGPTPDADLVEALNRGSVQAFEELYIRHRDWVVRLAYRFTGCEADALDVLQEAFAYLLRKTPRLQLHAKLTTFLYPVVKNLALTILRKRGRTINADAVLDQAVAPSVWSAASSAEASRAELAAALAGLPEGQREVLLMRFVDGMSLEEISDTLVIPVGTVKSRMHNALETLRQDPRMRERYGWRDKG